MKRYLSRQALDPPGFDSRCATLFFLSGQEIEQIYSKAYPREERRCNGDTVWKSNLILQRVAGEIKPHNNLTDLTDLTDLTEPDKSAVSKALVLGWHRGLSYRASWVSFTINKFRVKPLSE